MSDDVYARVKGHLGKAFKEALPQVAFRWRNAPKAIVCPPWAELSIASFQQHGVDFEHMTYDGTKPLAKRFAVSVHGVRTFRWQVSIQSKPFVDEDSSFFLAEKLRVLLHSERIMQVLQDGHLSVLRTEPIVEFEQDDLMRAQMDVQMQTAVRVDECSTAEVDQAIVSTQIKGPDGVLLPPGMQLTDVVLGDD